MSNQGDYSKPLPTEQRAADLKPEQFRKVNARDAQTMSGLMGGSELGGGSSLATGLGEVRHEPEYYEQWRKDQQAAVDRGEDPMTDFAKRAREHSDNQPLPKMIHKVEKLFGIGKKENSDGESKKQMNRRLCVGSQAGSL